MTGSRRFRFFGFILVALIIISFQNCNLKNPFKDRGNNPASPQAQATPISGGLPVSSGNQSGNGHPYEGKPYGSYGAPCPNGGTVRDVIDYVNPSRAFLRRENCVDLATPLGLAPLDFHLDPINAAVLIYQGRIFLLLTGPF